MSTIYTVEDTFNKRTVSRHRSLEAAVKSERKFLRSVKRSNGKSSYIPTSILKNGGGLTWEELDTITEIRIALDRK